MNLHQFCDKSAIVDLVRSLIDASLPLLKHKNQEALLQITNLN